MPGTAVRRAESAICTECPVIALGWIFALRNSRRPCQGLVGRCTG